MTLLPSTVLKLEIETTPPGGSLVNLIKNPDGELGGYGWVTPVSGSTLEGKVDKGYTNFLLALEYKAAGGVANFFYSEPYAVTPGQYIGASWISPYTAGYYKQKIEFLNSSQVLLSSSTQTGYLQGGVSMTTQYAAPFLIPASAAYARIRFDVYQDNLGANPPAGWKYSFRHVMMATGATSGSVTTPAFAPSVYWTDILGPSHELKIKREELNVGTLSATILDATLDPATATSLRPGKLVRLTANNPTTSAYEPLFNGKIDNAKVTYDVTRTDAKQARIFLTAVDNVTPLAGNARRDGVATIAQLPYLLEGGGVPWVCDGYSGQKTVGSVNIVSRNNDASLLDQIAITRDSEQGYAWVDRYGVLRAYSSSVMPQGTNLLPNGDFDTNITGWTAGANTTISQTGVATYEGQGSLRCFSVANGTQSAVSTLTDVEVRPGSKYRVEAFCKAQSNGRTMRIDVKWYDASSTLLSTVTGASGTNVTTGFTRYAGDYTAPANAKYMQIIPTVLSTLSADVYFWDSITVSGPSAFLNEATYSDIEIDFDSERCINEVLVKWLRYNAASGNTEEITYGPYRDETSIGQWGVRHADFKIQGVTEDSTAIGNFASAVLAANGTPVIRINSMQIPIKDTTLLKYAHLDLYDLVTLINTAKGISAPARITGIEHNITPDGWLTELDFAKQGGVAQPQLTPDVTPNAAVPRQSGSFAIASLAAGAFATWAISFTAGRFSTAPRVWAQGSSGRLNIAVRAITTTGCTIEAFNCSSASTGASESIQWLAELP